MTHELEIVEHWNSGDSKTFEYTVEEDDGTRDLSNDSLQWYLLPRRGSPLEDAVLSLDDDGVTRQDADLGAGRFDVQVAEDTAEESGMFYQRVVVDPPDETKQTWTGKVYIEA